MKSVTGCLAAIVLTSVFSNVADAQFVDLLRNRRLDHWITPSGESVREGWTFDPDGTLHLQGAGGNIITREKYGDFELWFEFRISEKGNSGIKYRVKKYGNSLLGCEYQILDDDAFPGLPGKQLTASLYDVLPHRSSPIRRRTGSEFNVGKVLVQGNRIRHWINGQLTIDTCAGTPGWNAAIANSKFRDREHFGQNRYGHIMLTDHRSEVWYRNVFIGRR